MDSSIFISYSHKDTETVKYIAEIIEKASGYTIWFDKNLRGGENYFSVIANQIVSSDFFAFIVSENSVVSDWCLRELEFAASENKVIVSIWINNAKLSPRVKLVIQNTHYIQYNVLFKNEFYNSIKSAFHNEGFFETVGNMETVDGDVRGDSRYFVENERVNKIEELLSLEKQGKYSACFEPENAYLLGLAYELGIKVQTDLKKAEFYYKISDYYGSYEGKYLYAAIRRSNSDAEDASKYLKEMICAAEHHSSYALTHLGDDYYYGRNGCEKNKKKAYEFWKQASELGSAQAMYYMAFGYRNGDNGPEDLELACMYALKATEYEFPRAYRILGFMHEDGDFFEQDYQKAIHFFEEAIKRGDYLSLCYEGWAHGKLGDYDKRRSLYEQALQYAIDGKIKSGLPFYRMGYIYKFGEGVPQNLIQAVQYYLQGAERKDKSSLEYTLSAIMDIEDEKQRMTYLKKAYELECEGTAYKLGQIEREKTNLERLSDEAIMYFTHGAEEQGDMCCALELIWNYSFIFGNAYTLEDRQKAIKWFQFLFANASQEFLDSLHKNQSLATYYYAYAMELDYATDGEIPDREFVQFYFKKSLDESLQHFPQIVDFTVNGYLFPEESDSGLPLDIAHGEEMLEMLKNYWESYCDYIIKTDWENCEKRCEEIVQHFKKGYMKISECYGSGKAIAKNKTKSAEYKKKTAQIDADMNDKFSMKQFLAEHGL